MPDSLGWQDVAVRLALSVLAGFIVGFNRGEHGHAAGLRTTILVCVAAAVAMIQANLLLAHTVNAEGHTITLDLMRLPLGILSGIGFIGAGAILRRGEMIRGVTTAATLWLITVIGLCFGGGQIGLGLAALTVAVATLWLLHRIEPRLISERHGTLVLELSDVEMEELMLRRFLETAGFHIQARHISKNLAQRKMIVRVHLRYRFNKDRDRPAELIRALTTMPRVISAGWSDAEL
jgi:putative Mg2+ transporter-C (MgtC) family protein